MGCAAHKTNTSYFYTYSASLAGLSVIGRGLLIDASQEEEARDAAIYIVQYAV